MNEFKDFDGFSPRLDMDVLKQNLSIRTPDLIGFEDAKKAGVLILLQSDGEGSYDLLLERRAADMRRQPGEISFPGGHVEPGDNSMKDAAVRETCEEFGIDKSELTVFGQLGVFTASSKLLIYPFVGTLNPETDIRPNSAEVDEVLYVPVKELLDYQPTCYDVEHRPLFPEGFPFHLIPGGPNYPFRTSTEKQYFYVFDNFVIWGLTARILNNFLGLLRDKPD